MPAAASLVRLDRLSAFIGICGSVNPFFELQLFIQAARKLLFNLTDNFSDTVLTEILENFLDRYLTSDTSSYDDSDVSEISYSSPILVPPTVSPTQAPVSDSLRDILSQSQHKAPVCSSVILSVVQTFLRQHSAYKMFGTRSLYNCIEPLTALTMQRLVVEAVIIPQDDVALDLFFRAHFLPLPTYDEVHKHFKT